MLKEPIMKPFSNILVPIDFSECSDQAISAALDLAARYDAALTLLYVHEPLPLVFPEGAGIYESMQLPNVTAELDTKLAQKKQELSAKGAKRVEAVQRNGHAPSEIADFAKSQGFDLIVMGTHGRRGLSHLMIGSVAERVVRTAPCPVLTVR
jgi:nucleotide-binding universal stress UspA family protein